MSVNVKLSEFLYKSSSSTILGLFRIISGLALAGFFLTRFSRTDYIDGTFVKAQILFKYPGLDFIEMGPPWLMYLLCHSLVFAAILLALGFLYRFASLYLLAVYSYLFFLDYTIGNNHFYLFILLFLFFSITNCHHSYSVDKKLWKLPSGVMNWNLNLFRFQFMIVYFMGGIAKLNSDWLEMKTAKAMTAVRIEGLSEGMTDMVAGLLTYGGLAFDLAVPFLLLFRKGRIWAFPLILIFNITNLFMHQIDIFPVIMIASYLLFIPTEKVEKFIAKWKKTAVSKSLEPTTPSSFRKKLIAGFLVVFVLFQLCFPFRHFLYKGNVLWTGDGYPFSWHMMTSFSGGVVKFRVRDKFTNEVFWISPEDHLNPRQHKFLFRYPELSVQFAHLLKKQALRDGLKEPEVNVILKVGLNGRPPQYMIDPDLDLTRVNVNVYKSNPWVLPLKTDE